MCCGSSISASGCAGSAAKCRVAGRATRLRARGSRCATSGAARPGWKARWKPSGEHGCSCYPTTSGSPLSPSVDPDPIHPSGAKRVDPMGGKALLALNVSIKMGRMLEGTTLGTLVELMVEAEGRAGPGGRLIPSRMEPDVDHRDIVV